MNLHNNDNKASDLHFDPHALAAEEMAFLYKGRNNVFQAAAISGLLVAVLIAWQLKSWSPAAWYAWLLLCTACHWGVGRSDPACDELYIPVAKISIHIMAVGLAGFGWGAAAFFMPLLDSGLRNIVLMVLLLQIVVAMLRFNIIQPMFYAYATGVIIPLLVSTALLSRQGMVESLALLGVVCILIVVSMKQIREMLVFVLQKQLSFQHASQEDRLTGLGNRLHFDRRLDEGWRQAMRFSVPLSVLVLDVDLFKKYNDRYGHVAGDECLQRVAGALSGCIKRLGDSVSRYGGEEFAVVMVHLPMREAEAMAERLRLAVFQLGLEHEASPHGRVSVSIGGATVVPKAGATAMSLVEKADEALYQAKENGRNRVEWCFSLDGEKVADQFLSQ